MEARVKSQVMTFFKISGFNLRSEVAKLLVDKIVDFTDNERKEFINKIYSSLQNQTLETASIEKDHMTAAIRVRIYRVAFRNWLRYDFFFVGMLSRQIQR